MKRHIHATHMRELTHEIPLDDHDPGEAIGGLRRANVGTLPPVPAL